MSRDAFLRRIRENPDDDTSRLVYADWLDEQGDADRAEFIRVGCEWARLLPVLTEWSYDLSACVDALRRRELELLRSHALAWAPAVPFRCIQFKEEGPTPSVAVGFASQQSLDAEFYFRRGFVESVTCTWADWRDHGDDVLACQPLRRVRLTTRPELEDVSDGDPATGGYKFRLRGRTEERWYGIRYAADHVAPHLLAAEWPGVEFELLSEDVYRAAAIARAEARWRRHEASLTPPSPR